MQPVLSGPGSTPKHYSYSYSYSYTLWHVYSKKTAMFFFHPGTTASDQGSCLQYVQEIFEKIKRFPSLTAAKLHFLEKNAQYRRNTTRIHQNYRAK